MKSEDHAISRVSRTKEQARRYYNSISSFYDLISGRSESRANRIGLAHLGIKGNDAVLEIGFGTGKILKEILSGEEYAGELFGIDLSQGMADKTRARLGENQERVSLFCGDAVSLPFQDKQFDKIFISFTLELFDTPEIPLVLNECRRVLNERGRICVISMSRREVNTLVRLYEAFHRIFPVRVDCRPILTRSFLEHSRFGIVENIEHHIAGLPVDIIIAEKSDT